MIGIDTEPLEVKPLAIFSGGELGTNQGSFEFQSAMAR